MSIRRPHILIADDDAFLTRHLARKLEAEGFHATVSPDAMHALNLAHRNAFDLIVLDIRMPAGNGLAAAEMLASDRRLQHVPIIILTGSDDAATRQRCRKLGTRHLLKSGDLWPRLHAMVCLLTNHEPAAASA